MQPTQKMPVDLTLTDFSFVQYRPTTDLYELLLSDHSQQLDFNSTESSGEKQPTWGQSVNGKEMIDFTETEEVEPKKVSYKCNCTKSRCSKNYCQCFRAGRQCSGECSCTDCSNDHDHVKKETRRIEHSGGCNCRKTRCLKKYCDCHSRGAKCTSKCNCFDCENVEEEKAGPEENPFVVIDAFYL